MVENSFQIFIDRLKDGQVERLKGPLSPSFLDIHEPELDCSFPVELTGEAYLTEDHLVIHGSASTKVKMPCAICNEMSIIPLIAKDFYKTVPLQEIPSAMFDVRELLREELLVELPQYIECQSGRCPGRSSLTPYLRSPRRSEESVHFPFSDLPS